MSHTEQSELAGKTVSLKPAAQTVVDGVVFGAQMVVEDWWDLLTGTSWMYSDGNPAALKYAMRIGPNSAVPLDDDVLYGKIGSYGHLVHLSEIGEVLK